MPYAGTPSSTPANRRPLTTAVATVARPIATVTAPEPVAVRRPCHDLRPPCDATEGEAHKRGS